MDKDNQLLDFTQIDQIACGDVAFKKELIEIFMVQIPDFIENMNVFYEKNDYVSLAREAHTAKSSALIFGMKETGDLLKQIQLFAEQNEFELIPSLVEKAGFGLNEAEKQLKVVLGTL